jgi:hypothetical protein
VIYFTCPECLREHPARVQVSRALLEKADKFFGDMPDTCPTTGRNVTYGRDRMLWRAAPSDLRQGTA